ncbi:MAG: TRAP transporter small permease [Cellvibrionaceae bacterium]
MSDSDLNTLEKKSPFIIIIESLGAIALVGMIILITISVIGRHLNIPVPGSVEIVEILIVIVASTGILFATIQRSHASAKLFVEHLPARIAHFIERIGLLVGLLIMLTITAGSIWLLIDVWNLHETSHLLEIPIVPFRIFFTACAFGTSLVLFYQMIATRT